jgi:transposase-like protein
LICVKKLGSSSACNTIALLREMASVENDGAAGLEKAIAAVWDGVPVQRCTVRKHRNLLAHARWAGGRVAAVARCRNYRR